MDRLFRRKLFSNSLYVFLFKNKWNNLLSCDVSLTQQANMADIVFLFVFFVEVHSPSLFTVCVVVAKLLDLELGVCTISEWNKLNPNQHVELDIKDGLTECLRVLFQLLALWYLC